MVQASLPVTKPPTWDTRLMRHPPSLRTHSMRTDLYAYRFVVRTDEFYNDHARETGHFYRALYRALCRALLNIYRALLTQRTLHFVMSRPLGLHTCCSPATRLQHTCNTPATHLQHTYNIFVTHLQQPAWRLQHTFKRPTRHSQDNSKTAARQQQVRPTSQTPICLACTLVQEPNFAMPLSLTKSMRRHNSCIR